MPHHSIAPSRRRLALLFLGLTMAGALPDAATAAEMITEWKRAQVRVRQRPDGEASRVPATDLPLPATVLERTPDGQLKFIDRQGRPLYVSLADVATVGAPAKPGPGIADLCPAAPTDPTRFTGSVVQRTEPRPTVGQGMGGGKRC